MYADVCVCACMRADVCVCVCMRADVCVRVCYFAVQDDGQTCLCHTPTNQPQSKILPTPEPASHSHPHPHSVPAAPPLSPNEHPPQSKTTSLQVGGEVACYGNPLIEEDHEGARPGARGKPFSPVIQLPRHSEDANVSRT